MFKARYATAEISKTVARVFDDSCGPNSVKRSHRRYRTLCVLARLQLFPGVAVLLDSGDNFLACGACTYKVRLVRVKAKS
jgi:hypothetical protein